MTQRYREFIYELKRRMIELNLTPSTASEYMKVAKSTFYNWLNLKTVMSGEDMLRCIDTLMGGRYEKRRTLP